MRDGKFALMMPVRTSTLGRCVASTRWMPAARAICASRCSDSSTSRADTTIRSASSSITTTMYGSCGGTRSRRPARRPRLQAQGLLPAASFVARLLNCSMLRTPSAAIMLVALLHLVHDAEQRRRGALGVGDDVGDQVRNALVDRELEHLRIDQQQLQLVRRRAHRMRAEQRVQEHALAGAGRARDQQVRHLREIRRRRGLPKMSLPSAIVSFDVLVRKLSRLEQIADVDHVALGVRAPRCRRRTCPGSGAMMRTEIARSASARSSERFTMRLTLTPERRLELVHRDRPGPGAPSPRARARRSPRASSRGSASS